MMEVFGGGIDNMSEKLNVDLVKMMRNNVLLIVKMFICFGILKVCRLFSAFPYIDVSILCYPVFFTRVL